jgi:deoxyadenosine/deoxycytidine kinase
MFLNLFSYINFFLNKIEIKIEIKNQLKNVLIIINRMNCEIQIISIEGNIGSGKSTLLEKLKKHFKNNINIIFLREPVNEWSNIKDEKGVTILEKFYADQEKYSFSFQMMAYISRLKLIRDCFNDIRADVQKNSSECANLEWNSKNKLKYFIITERSLFTDKMVFAKMLYDTGKIEKINYEIYLNWFNTFADDFPVKKIIYVKVEPETCYKRVGKRDRDGEDKIPLDYLESCNNYHNNMLDKSLDECVCKNQLVLDGNIDIYENNNALDEWICSVEKFVYN